jgi:hypothetical protein
LFCYVGAANVGYANRCEVITVSAPVTPTTADLIELELLVSGLGRFLDELDVERAPLPFDDRFEARRGDAGRRFADLPTCHRLTQINTSV